MRAIAIGRHVPDLGAEDIEVIETRNIQFPESGTECWTILEGLIVEAKSATSVVLLQNAPGQVAVALVKHSHRLARPVGPGFTPGQIGVVVAVPGPRLAGVSKDFNFDIYELPGASLIERARELALFCNGRAKIEMIPSEPPEKWWCTLRVTVDPIPQFVFSHIEWL